MNTHEQVARTEESPRVNYRDDRKYVFVCGMARSGTSLLGRNIARFEDCTGFKNTGVPEDEGQFLQDVYLTASSYGGSSRVGFDPRAHRTEGSSLFTSENVARLKESWNEYWESDKSICIEKTPENLLMTRFLQAAFPNSYFVVIRRHPVPVAMASQKWKVNVTSLDSLFRHWLHCYALFEGDRKYLRRVYELRYEDYVENQEKYHQEIADFIGTRVPEPPREDSYRYVTQWRNPTGLRVPEKGMEKTSTIHNQKYLDRWYKLLEESPFCGYYRYLVRKYEEEFNRYGYSLTKEGMEVPARGILSDAMGRLGCVAANTGALTWRIAVRSKERLRLASKVVLPQIVVDKVRQRRERMLLNSQGKAS
jgi:Sulfotransferase family